MLVVLGKIPCAYFSLSIFANMQAIVNAYPIEISAELMKSRFFAEWSLFPTAHDVMAFDTEFFDEFLLLNMPLLVQPQHFRNLHLYEICRLANTMEYFGAYSAFTNIAECFQNFFLTMGVSEMFEYRDMMKDLYCPEFYENYIIILRTKFGRMTIPEITYALRESDLLPYNGGEIIRAMYDQVYVASRPFVIDAIETAIMNFTSRSNWQYPAVHWIDVNESGLSDRFITEHQQDHTDYIPFFNSVEMGEIDGFFEQHDRPLFLSDLPIERYMHMTAWILTPGAGIRWETGRDIYYLHRQWSDYGVEYAQFSYINNYAAVPIHMPIINSIMQAPGERPLDLDHICSIAAIIDRINGSM